MSRTVLSDLLGFLVLVFCPCKLQLEHGRKGSKGVRKEGENNNNNNNNNNRIFTQHDRSVPSTVINGVRLTKKLKKLYMYT